MSLKSVLFYLTARSGDVQILYNCFSIYTQESISPSYPSECCKVIFTKISNICPEIKYKNPQFGCQSHFTLFFQFSF